MTVPRIIEMVFSAEAFPEPPQAGEFYASQSGLTAMSISKVRKVVGDRAGTRYRLIGLRVRLSDLPASATVLPWPKRVKLASRAAMVVMGPPPPPSRGVSPGTKKTEERRRVIGLLRDDRDSNRVVHKVRIENQTALTGDWRDPSDTNPNRRIARTVHGYRARDSIQTLLDNNTISTGHAHAARRFRREFELGEIGLRPARSLEEAPNGFASGIGPSEARMRALQAYQATARSLMPHLLEVVIAIVISDETIISYAERKKMNRQSVSGYILASFDVLRDIYSERDKEERVQRETIGAQLGPAP